MKFSNIQQAAFGGFLALGLLVSSPAVFAQSQVVRQAVKTQSLPDIRSGMTKADVEKILGKPTATPTWLSGASTWTYRTDLDAGMRYDVDFGMDGKVTRAGLYRAYETGNT